MIYLLAGWFYTVQAQTIFRNYSQAKPILFESHVNDVFEAHYFSENFSYLPANNKMLVFPIKPSTEIVEQPALFLPPEKEPFFCNMESKVHKHLNLWIKLRTGNDDSYMKMIGATPYQHR